MHRFTRTAALVAVAAAVLPAAASAHVTLQPEQVPAGGFTRLDVRVPNERDNASTTKVEVKFPAGFIFVSHEPEAGWDAEVEMAKLDEPVEVFGERHNEQVDTVTFTARGKGIGPGQFRDFGLSVGLPDRPGTALTFRSLQTYSSGEVVRWIGAPDADEPAPRVELTAATEAGAPAHGETPAAQATPAAAAAGVDDDDDGGSTTLSVVALVVGGLGLLAGMAGFAASRRRGATAAA